MPTTKNSNAWGFSGYSIKIWMLNNKDLLKALIAVVLAAIGAVQTGDLSWSASLKVIGFGFATTLLKWAADALDYATPDVVAKKEESAITTL